MYPQKTVKIFDLQVYIIPLNGKKKSNPFHLRFLKAMAVRYSLIYKTIYDCSGTLFWHKKEKYYFVVITINKFLYSIYLYLSTEN